MGKKKPVEPESESGEDEDEASSEELGSSDSYSEPEQCKFLFLKKPNKSQPLISAKPQQPSPFSDDEETGSESEEVGSVAMDSPQNSKTRSKPNPATDNSSPAKSTGAKRKKMEAYDNKRSKKKLVETQPETPVALSKKLLFQRFWSEDDEIVVLQGMIEYAEKNRSYPVTDLNAFHDFVKKNLHVDATRVQLQDKIRRLKKKYENNKQKEKEGRYKTFTKTHEQKAYELSKIVWGKSEKGQDTGVVEKVMGSPKGNGSAARRRSSSKKVNNVVEYSHSHSKEVKSLEIDENGELAILVSKMLVPKSAASMEERILGIGAELFEGDKKLEGAREWTKLRKEDVELYLKKLDLISAQTKLVLDILRSTDE